MNDERVGGEDLYHHSQFVDSWIILPPGFRTRRVSASANSCLPHNQEQVSTLCVKQTGTRPSARNPRTGERVGVPARRKVRFKPGQVLREGMRLPRPKG